MEEFKVYEEGGYIFIKNDLVEGWHKCKNDEFFANMPAYDKKLEDSKLKWVGAPIPKDILGPVADLASKYPKMEVIVCLYYNKKTKEWLVNVPKQKGWGAYVKYSDEDFETPKGYTFMGTIHTHPEMGAFWSGTDLNDQKLKSGLHMVLGLKNGKIKHTLCSLFYNGKQYDQDTFELPGETEEFKAPEEWVAKVEQQEEPIIPIVNKVDNSSYTFRDREFEKSCSYWTDNRYYREVLDSIPIGDSKEMSADDLEGLDPVTLYDIAIQALYLLGENELATNVEEAAKEAEETLISSDSSVDLTSADYEDIFNDYKRVDYNGY